MSFHIALIKHDLIGPLEGYDFTHFLQLIELFPTHPLAMLLKGYFTYASIPLSKQKDDEDGSDQLLLGDHDPFDAMLVSVSSQSYKDYF
jgi:hypothetical protein